VAEAPRIRIDRLILSGVPVHKRAALVAALEKAAAQAASGPGPASSLATRVEGAIRRSCQAAIASPPQSRKNGGGA
jgi:hypothetical protein